MGKKIKGFMNKGLESIVKGVKGKGVWGLEKELDVKGGDGVLW